MELSKIRQGNVSGSNTIGWFDLTLDNGTVIRNLRAVVSTQKPGTYFASLPSVKSPRDNRWYPTVNLTSEVKAAVDAAVNTAVISKDFYVKSETAPTVLPADVLAVIPQIAIGLIDKNQKSVLATPVSEFGSGNRGLSILGHDFVSDMKNNKIWIFKDKKYAGEIVNGQFVFNKK